MISRRMMLGIDFALVGVTVCGIILMFMFARPVLHTPADGFVTTTGAVVFSFDRAERILIDDNLQFTSPQVFEVKDNLLITLPPGAYYWKVEGSLESEVRQLTIESHVALKVRDAGNGSYELVNAGNTRLNVDIYDHGRLTGNVIVETENSTVAEGTMFKGGQHE